MIWIPFAAVFLAYAVLLSLAAGKDWPPLRSKGLQAPAIFLFFALFFMTVWTMRDDAGPFTMAYAFPLILFGLLSAYRFILYLIGDWFETAHRWGIGLDRMTVPNTYDLAEKAEHERDWDGAVGLYREACAKDPADPEPWRRIAEIEVRRERLEDSIPAFRGALARLKEPESKSTLSFRLAEILARLGRKDEARTVVEGVAREFAGTKFAEFANERLRQHHPDPPSR